MLRKVKPINNDGEIELAIGKSSDAYKWHNTKMKWSDFLKRCQQPHRTHETHAQYLKMPKQVQAQIKNIGGYFGGHLREGRRLKQNVRYRTLLTLDLDFAGMDFFDNFKAEYNYAAVVYSTHKHDEQNPRLRLVCPLSRPVGIDEHEALARRVASMFDINIFDDTTFDANRMMYWFSCSKDSVPYMNYQDGPFMDVDAILEQYTDWQDMTEWAYSERVTNKHRSDVREAEDPTLKNNIIGDFCRAYTIDEAIAEFLDDIYILADDDSGRYSYEPGEGAKGAIPYNDSKFLYSHHGTDPANGLNNAFDLVRIHKYGKRDAAAREGTPSNQLPSYLAMVEMAQGNKRVRKLSGERKWEAAKAEFADFLNSEDAADVKADIDANKEWVADLEVDANNKYTANVRNLKLILQKDVMLSGRIAYNQFTGKIDVLKPFHWDIDKRPKNYPREWTDDDLAQLNCYLGEKPYEFQTLGKLENVLVYIKMKNAYHPVKDYLGSLEWDGEERLDTLFIDFLGVEDSEYSRQATRKCFVAGVARVYDPGCKNDYSPVLVGNEGIRKSTIIRKMGKGWFTDTFSFSMLAQGVRAYEQIQGYWVIEIPEMSGLKKADSESAKAFMTSGKDNYRASYAKNANARLRQCIFIGNSNNLDFLKNTKGNRRYWPLLCEVQAKRLSILRDLTDEYIDQVWAEAIYRYEQGEELYLTDELEAIAKEIRKGHTETDDRQPAIEEYLTTLLPEDWHSMGHAERLMFLRGHDGDRKGTVMRTRVCAAEIWVECFERDRADMTPHNTKFIHDCISLIGGWSRYKGNIKIPRFGSSKAYILDGFDPLSEVEILEDFLQ